MTMMYEIVRLVYHLYSLNYDEVLIVDPETPITREEYEKAARNMTIERKDIYSQGRGVIRFLKWLLLRSNYVIHHEKWLAFA